MWSHVSQVPAGQVMHEADPPEFAAEAEKRRLTEVDVATVTVWVNGERTGVMARPSPNTLKAETISVCK